MAHPIRHSLVAAAAIIGVVGGTWIAAAQPAGPGRGAGPGMMGGGGPGTMGGGPGGGGPGMMGGGGPGMRGGAWTTGSYLDSLKARLGITDKQAPAWQDYAETVTGVSQQMQGLHQTMFEAMGTASWEERRDMMNQMFQARQQASDTVHEAAGKLLASLTPKQQGAAEQILPGLAYGPGMMGGGGMHGGRGMGGGMGPGRPAR